MPLIQTSNDSIKFTLSINETKDLGSLCLHGQNNDTIILKDIQVFVEDIEDKFKSNSFGFAMFGYLRYNIFKELMNQIETLLASLNEKGRTSFVRTSLTFTSYQSPMFNKYTDTWNITINGINELKYAEGLLFVYKNYVKPFMDELNYEIQDPGDLFYRSLYTIGIFIFLFFFF
jgi:hypothetical protein